MDSEKIKVELFTSNVCPKCKQAKGLLTELIGEVGRDMFQLEFIDVVKNIDRSVELGILATPALVINHQLISSTLPRSKALKAILIESLKLNNH